MALGWGLRDLVLAHNRGLRSVFCSDRVRGSLSVQHWCGGKPARADVLPLTWGPVCRSCLHSGQ